MKLLLTTVITISQDYIKKIDKLEWGRFAIKFGIPVIEIITPEKESFWLSAFRGYSFQVSGDIEGHGDYGSTDVFGLGNLIPAEVPDDGVDREWLYRVNFTKQGSMRYMISMAAYHAVMKFAMSWACYPPTDRYDGFNKNEEWAKFIDAVYIMITSGKTFEHDTDEEGKEE